ncbi:acetolactate synthase [Leucobacter sp. cx-328]|uniref:thiamine pyrophosphate-binding protein n=1 Tax=unclassified Leucobacter TaxID=2621730 RepID=UPI00165D658A|nr:MULTISPECIES: thiamine pyrophosphate-binding protein [unclassified Leucobacter]MBC9943190.1 acetolactate synthase [Leucobacter sp. cx-328]
MSTHEGHVGLAIARSLELHGVDRVFTVPGESYLAVLDGLRDTGIRNVVCRQEGGAAYMADAYGRATSSVGVAMVTRGPGAANAFVAVHTAWQDASPLVLFVGLVPVPDRDREAFQEFDPRAWFGSQAKRVLILDNADRASEVVAEAFHAARSGRPGPVIVGLPEDVVASGFAGGLVEPYATATGAIAPEHIAELQASIAGAERPLLFLAGEGWTDASATAVRTFAERHELPVINDWHGTWRIPTTSPACIGQSAFGTAPHATKALEEADLIVCFGGTLTDTPTDSFRITRAAGSQTIVISGDAALRGHMGRVNRHYLATPEVLPAALAGISALGIAASESRTAWSASLRTAYLASREVQAPAAPDGYASMTRVISQVAAQFADPIVTMGAGNHGAWGALVHTTSPQSELGPRNGSMGYSIPAATAAALARPNRNVLALAGDGEFLMNGQELATAVQEGAAFLAVVMDNQQFGTIRVHQEREYPGRVSGTQVTSPDFAGLAAAYGAHAEDISADDQISGAVTRAIAAVEAGRVALLHVHVDPAVLLPE